jgi:hypothetical protein
MPKSVKGKAKQLIHEMYLAPTRKAAPAAYDQFLSSRIFEWEAGQERINRWIMQDIDAASRA